MKNYILSLVLLITLVFSVNAQTRDLSLITTDTSAPALIDIEKQSGGWELTLGGGGETLNGESYFGLDFSLSTNPFESRPEVWVGIAQSLYWEPSLAGSTDLYVDWNWHIYGEKLYLNTGWSVGGVYDNSGTATIWRTGPEVAGSALC